MLLMKKIYFDAIRRGEKTTTLRYWRYPQVRPGAVYVIRGLGRVGIDDLAVVRMEDFTDAHARADGFEDLPALREALDALYPPPHGKTASYISCGSPSWAARRSCRYVKLEARSSKYCNTSLTCNDFRGQ